MIGTDLLYGPVCLRGRYAMPGTNLAYALLPARSLGGIAGMALGLIF